MVLIFLKIPEPHNIIVVNSPLDLAQTLASRPFRK